MIFVGIIVNYQKPRKIKPANIYLFKDSNRNTRKKYKICSKLTIKAPQRHYWQLTFTCSNSTIETLGKSVKFVQSYCSGVFMLAWTYFTPSCSVSVADFELGKQVKNIPCWRQRKFREQAACVFEYHPTDSYKLNVNNEITRLMLRMYLQLTTPILERRQLISFSCIGCVVSFENIYNKLI